MYQQNLSTGELVVQPATPPPAARPLLRDRAAKWFGTVISLSLLGVIIFQLRSLGLQNVLAMVPVSVSFWVVFAVFYLSGPASEWVIYRRLWGIPASGMAALIRKFVSNELLLGYLGEAQFYAWARGRTHMTTAPFGAIKDVTILSALAGNIATLAMLAVTWPLISLQHLGTRSETLFASLSVVLGTSLVVFLFRRSLFSLPTPDLWFIAAVHGVRILAIVGLAALLWHLVLPTVTIGLWLVLSTLRMLVSRLPLVPNKDVVFAGIATFMLGHNTQIAGLLTMMAVLLLVTHLILGAGLAAADLARPQRINR